MDFTNFLLVYPETPDTYWSYKHAISFVGKKALMPPLGLATIAAMIPERYSVRLVDMNVEPLTDDDLKSADLVLLSAMLVQKTSFQEVVARCNRVGVPVAAGGPYPTSCPDEMSAVDFLVLNEGETTFPRFLDDWLAGQPQRVYEDASRPDIRTAPIPRFDVIDMDRYDTLPLQFSRGCPFHCEFCDIVHLFGHTPRTKTPEQFIRELDAAYRTGFRGSLFIVDDNFIGNKHAVKRLLPAIEAWQQKHGMPYQLATEASLNLAADDELLAMMERAGFVMAFIGIESPVEESLNLVGKTQNLQNDMAQAIRKIQSHGIEVTAGFIVGFDTDPIDIFDRQIRFVEELAVPVAMVGLLMALPHTKLWERLDAEGRILSRSDGNNTHGSLLNFRTTRDPVELVRGYRRVLGTIYRPRNYFHRCIELLRRLPAIRPAHGSGNRIHYRELRALARSLAVQTFSRYGFSYLGYLVHALIVKPSQVVRIFTLAIQGHHFFTITRAMLQDLPQVAEAPAKRERARRSSSAQPVSVRL